MTVKSLFFAHYQDIVGSREQRVTVADGATVGDLAALLQKDFPELGDLLKAGRVAVDAEFAGTDTTLHEGVEVAWMPPMSGGC